MWITLYSHSQSIDLATPIRTDAQHAYIHSTHTVDMAALTYELATNSLYNWGRGRGRGKNGMEGGIGE